MMVNNTTTKHMEKNNMTAVEWFFEVLAHNDIIDHKRLCVDENLYNLLYSLKNQAKQMEKEQIIKAYVEGINLVPCDLNSTDELDAEKYYHKTFGNK